MMIGKKMQEAINRQIKEEMYSAYLYLAMSAYFESQNLKGFGHWVRIQAKEEMGHAMRFYDYVVERLGRVTLGAIEQPTSEWKGATEVFEQVLSHEQKVTGLINNLMEQAIAEKDYASQSMLKWFIDEQVEEEASADEILQKLKIIKESPGALLMLDKQLGKREEGK